MMKGNFTRLLAFLLMLTVVVSVLSVFATAADDDAAEEEEGSEKIELFLNRTFDDGWDLSNGFSSNWNQTPRANFFVDYETDSTFKKNYFLRAEFGDRSEINNDHYFEFGSSNTSDYLVLQFKIKVDDTLHYNNRVAYSKGGTKQNNLLSVNKDSIKAFNQTLCETSVDWITLTYVFDYTMNATELVNGTPQEYGTCNIVATNDKGDELGTMVVDKVWAISTMRFGNHDKNTTVVGESVCFDDFRFYYTNTGRVLEADEVNALGYGSLVNADRAPNVAIDKGDGTGAGSVGDPVENSACFKVGIDHYLLNGEERLPIRAVENGEAYGAPVVHNGKIYLAVDAILDMLGYEYYTHSDGLAYDVSSGLSATSIYAGRISAVADGKDVYLSVAPEMISETVGGETQKYLAICIDDIETIFPDVHMTYDTMGFIMLSLVDPDYDHEADQEIMLTLMKKFIYPPVDSEVIRDLAIKQTTEKNGEALKHPYIYATQEQFDLLANAYKLTPQDEEYDPYLDKSLASYVKSADTTLKTWAASISEGDEGWDEAENNYKNHGIGLRVEGGTNGDVIYLPYLSVKPGNGYDPTHVGLRASTGKIITEADALNATNNGYDKGGRLEGGPTTIAERAQELAFAYQITGNLTYAMVAYELLIGLAEWDHWGPGHFLNCADAAQRYAVAYDWLYNAFEELETSENPAIKALREEHKYSRQAVAEGLYWNGLYAAYSTAIEKKLPANRNNPELTTGQILPGTTHGYTGWHRAHQNWNCVCNCGIILTALALLGETDETRVGQINTLLTECFKGLSENGLDCYAPDGSYPESAGYWEYGTVQFFKTVAAFNSACGTDFNLLNAPGIDKTCYYAINIVSSDSYRFGYHDDGNGKGDLDTSWFIMVGEELGDEGVIQLRMNKIRNGMNLSYGDLLYWNEEYINKSYELPKSYFMDGIDTFVVRDGWEQGSLFTGLHGGPNLVNHGDIDAGTFVYLNDGTYWFCELGSDNYNVGNYFSNAERYKYYRKNTEGQNTICITGDQANVMYGQRSDGEAKTIAYGENEHGAYHILDMSSCYWTNTNYGYRGILVTNDFKTTVIQDNIDFKTMTSLYWFAHTEVKYDNIDIVENGRVAYLTNSKGHVLRVTLVSNRTDYKFTKMTAYDTVLDVTLGKGVNPNEDSRETYSKLAIQAENTLSFKVAVVIERVASKDDATPLGYTLEHFGADGNGMYDPVNQIVNWVPYTLEETEDDDVDVDVGDGLVIKPQSHTIPLNESTVVSNMNYIDLLVGEGDHYGIYLPEFYKSMVEIEYTGIFLPQVQSTAKYTSYLTYKEEYHAFIEKINVELDHLSNLSKAMLGF